MRATAVPVGTAVARKNIKRVLLYSRSYLGTFRGDAFSEHSVYMCVKQAGGALRRITDNNH